MSDDRRRLAVARDGSISRIDAAIAARMQKLFVTEAPDETDDCVPLFDLLEQDAAQMLADYEADYARYATTPFDPDGQILKLYPGGVSIWSGFPGAGKTTLLRQLACHLLQRGESVFYASLEEYPRDLVIRLAATAAGVVHPTLQQLLRFQEWCGQLKVWGFAGNARCAQLLGAVRVTRCTHAIIDSLMKLDVDNGDFEAQRRFANALAETAKKTRAHIHLVAHPRKVVSVDQELDLNDVAGAREIGGIADNVIFIRRAKNESLGDDQLGMAVAIRKQRHGSGALGSLSGWYQRNWRQFHLAQFPAAPFCYLPVHAYEVNG